MRPMAPYPFPNFFAPRPTATMESPMSSHVSPVPSSHVALPSGAVRGSDVSEFIADIPLSAYTALAQAFEDGKAKGYPRDNWRKGFPTRNLIAHAITHLVRYRTGDTSEDHLSHALWNVMVLIEQQSRPDLDDRNVPIEPLSPEETPVQYNAVGLTPKVAKARLRDILSSTCPPSLSSEAAEQQPTPADPHLPENTPPSSQRASHLFEADIPRARLVHPSQSVLSDLDADEISFWLRSEDSTPSPQVRIEAYAKCGKKRYKLLYSIIVNETDLLP